MSAKEYTPGSLVSYRGRDWIVMPGANADLVNLRPLGGSEVEATAVYLPLDLPGEAITGSQFPPPTEKDLGDFATARMLFHASRLSFRQASGPFRCMGRLSFRPRNYQIVPLVMALEQRTTRLMIADDVGIGKTVEGLLVMRELLERGVIRRFAVLCPPHLCDQWRQELQDKLDIEAVVVRTGTYVGLQRKVPAGTPFFEHYPYQVISIDFIKSDRWRPRFMAHAPELVIVDEAHTCARPAGTTGKGQQMRYRLLREVAERAGQHLVMLTATPHSGKDEEFLSLLGLLSEDLEELDLEHAGKAEREAIARHFIQRKREDIRDWLGEKTDFPDRIKEESTYELSNAYREFYKAVVDYARAISGKEGRGKRMRYWAALSLLRGCVSSPANAKRLLENRYERRVADAAEGYELPEETSLLDASETDSDATETDIIGLAGLEQGELQQLRRLAAHVDALHGPEHDHKLREAITAAKKLLREGFKPIFFCRYIETANYLAAQLKEALPGTVQVEAITSDLADEQRRQRVNELGAHKKCVLVATDCLSEGINLQEHFTAVVHYDLPWNPNRLEQREGRVDRFGQPADHVVTWLLRGKDNPVDLFVLDVLIEKVRQIQNDLGVQIAIGETNANVMDAAVRQLILDPDAIRLKDQLTIDFGESSPEVQEAEKAMTRELDAMKKRAQRLRKVFTHAHVDLEAIEQDLAYVDEAIGDEDSVEAFVLAAIRHLGGTVERDEDTWKVHVAELPDHLRELLGADSRRVSFTSPTPEGSLYLGRNHRFTDQLCQAILALSFDKERDHHPVARTAVVVTDRVRTRTTVVLFRVRNVIREQGSQREVIGEELYVWGYEGSRADGPTLDYATAKALLLEAVARGDRSEESQRKEMKDTLQVFAAREEDLFTIARQRADALVKAHSRFKGILGDRTYAAVQPVLPPDVLGVYLLLPPAKPLPA